MAGCSLWSTGVKSGCSTSRRWFTDERTPRNRRPVCVLGCEGKSIARTGGRRGPSSPGQMLLELDAQGRVRHRYLWGPAVDQILADEQVFPLPVGEGQGEGLAAVQGGGQARAQGEGPNLTMASTVLWPLTDHLGTVRDLARYNPDTDRTTIVNHLTYDAFGQMTGQSNPAVTTLFAFTGRPLDPATALQNHLHRWYDPAMGRWLSEDPLGFYAAEANLYRYCGNNPAVGRDPTGLEEWQLHLSGHGGPHIQLGNQRWNAITLEPIRHAGQLPPRLTEAQLRDLAKKGILQKIAKNVPESIVREAAEEVAREAARREPFAL